MNIYFYGGPRVYKEQPMLGRVGKLPFEPGERLEDGKELYCFVLQPLGFLFLLLQSTLHYFLAHVANKKVGNFQFNLPFLNQRPLHQLSHQHQRAA